LDLKNLSILILIAPKIQILHINNLRNE